MEASMHKSAVRKWGRLVRDCFSVWEGNHQPFFFLFCFLLVFSLWFHLACWRQAQVPGDL